MARSQAAREAQVPQRLILDSGAVLALSKGQPRARALLGRALEMGAEVLVPAVVVAETVRGDGPRDAPVNRVINAVDAVTGTDEPAARIAGRLLGQARSKSTIDALVVAAAIANGGGRIVTGDVGDLRTLSQGSPEVIVHAI